VLNRVDGKVLAVDEFGNLVTDITREMLADAPHDDSVVIHCDGHETYRMKRTEFFLILRISHQ